MATGKLKLQQQIRNKFGEWQIVERKQRLCSKCVSYDCQQCKYGLLPITSNGEDCPYFEEKKEENYGH